MQFLDATSLIITKNNTNIREFYQISFDKHMACSSALLYFILSKYVKGITLPFLKSLNSISDIVQIGSQNTFFYKGPDSKYFWLCQPGGPYSN